MHRNPIPLRLCKQSGGLFFILFLAFGFFLQSAAAQVLYGTIVGNIKDESGAIIAGATVTATNTETGLTREAVTNENGDYTIQNIQPGTYDVKITKQGFSTSTRTGVPVSVNFVSRIEANLKVGEVTEQVSVTSDATLLQTDSAEVKSELSSKEINTLPLNQYRNYQALLDLVPGTTPAMFQNSIVDTPGRALATNVNGTAKNINTTRTDGATNTLVWFPHHTAYVAPAETIQEVVVATSSFDAEQGLAGGAAITVQTKSGTNDFHGSAFGYHTDQRFRTRPYFLPSNFRKLNGRDVPVGNLDIFGGTVGGPIVHDKLFFFGGWERTRDRSAFNALYTVPTLAERAGDFSQSGTNIFDTASGSVGSRTQFANNVIPANRISPISKKIIDLIPLPNLAGSTSNYFNAASQRMLRDNYDLKINWNRSASHQIWGKYSRMHAVVTGYPGLGIAGSDPLGGASGTGDTVIQLYTFGTTWTLSPTFIVDGNFGITRMDHESKGYDFGTNFGSDVFGIPGTNGSDELQSGFPTFAISGGFSTLGQVSNWIPAVRNDRSYTASINISNPHGTHDLRYGFDLVRHELNHFQPEVGKGSRGGFDITGGGTANSRTATITRANNFAQFLLGYYNTGGISGQPYGLMTGREWQFGWYVRDRWQVRQNLTLNLGLRLEHYPLMRRADRGVERVDFNTPPGTRFNLLIGGLGNIPEDAGIKTQKVFLAPRVGLAYRFRDSTVIRAGYGLTIDPLPFSRPLRGFYPLTVATDFTGPDSFTPYGTFSQGIPAVPVLDLSSGTIPLPTNVFVRTPPEGKLDRGYIQSWNLAVERKLPWDFVAEAAYVGTQTTHQLADLNINAAAPGAGNTGRPFASRGYTSDINYWDGWLSANYHSLQTSLNRRFTRGLFIKAAYTYSKAINWTDEDGWASVGFNHPSVLSRNRALAGYDRTHNLQVGFAAELPFGKGKSWASEGVASAILGGWQVNGVASAVSGTPFTITASNVSLNAPGNTQTADQVGAFKILGGVGSTQPWFDTTAFKPVTDVRFGTTGRNAFRGPGYGNIDFSLFRTFPLSFISESSTLQFRAEAFNITNTPRFANPNANASNTNFGTITSTLGTVGSGSERFFRFGLRFGF